MFFSSDMQVRFNDTDAYGHLNNVAFAIYAEFGRVEFLHKVAGQRGNLILAHLSTDFVQQIRWTQSVQVCTWVKKIGNSSISLYQEILADGTLSARVNSTVVLYDYLAQSKIHVPEYVREQVNPYKLGKPNRTLVES